jgi:hypothetical protein
MNKNKKGVRMKVYRIKCNVCKKNGFSFINDKNYICLNCVVKYNFGKRCERNEFKIRTT